MTNQDPVLNGADLTNDELNSQAANREGSAGVQRGSVRLGSRADLSLKSMLDDPRGLFNNKVGRYLVVSVINVGVHFSLLRLALWAWEWPGEWANAFAAAMASIPAFLLSRYWVWQVKGRAEVMAEIIPFWVLAALGLVVSSAMAGVGDRLSDDYRVIMAASFIGYLMVWIMKFAVLNALFARSKVRQDRRTDQGPGH